ncbi:MAG TPA: hypothetical protein ACHBX0_01245 [Arsenophonus sp.]
MIMQYAGKKHTLFVGSATGGSKNIETNFKPIKGITSARITGNGSVALIPDVKQLYQLAYMKR